MKSLLLIFTAYSAILSAQKKTEDFLISIPERKDIKSEFSKIKLIDARPDTTNVGIVQKGAFNSKAKVIPVKPLQAQFQELLSSISKNPSADGELLLYLKQFYFAEVTGAFSEKGYCYVQGYLFSKDKDGTYQLRDELDSVIVHSSMDVTKATMKKGSEMFSNFIIKNLYPKENSGEKYSYEQIKNYDKIAKQKFPLYNQEVLTDGLYKTFKDFRSLTPAAVTFSSIKTTPDGNRVLRVSSNESGKEKDIRNTNEYFAMVYQGIPYVYSPIEKSFNKMTKDQNNDFLFTAKSKTTAKNGDVMMASLFFGVVGAIIASDASASFEMKLDYLNGGFIPIKEVKK